MKLVSAALALFATTALAMAACVNGDTVGTTTGDDVGANREVVVDREFTLVVHEMVKIEGTHVLLFFDGVSEDSRCPTDVQCPWAGNAAARFEVSSDIAEFAPQPFVLNTTLEPHAADKLGLTIRLVDVTPYPKAAGTPIDPASYVVKLVVTRS